MGGLWFGLSDGGIALDCANEDKKAIAYGAESAPQRLRLTALACDSVGARAGIYKLAQTIPGHATRSTHGASTCEASRRSNFRWALISQAVKTGMHFQ